MSMSSTSNTKVAFADQSQTEKLEFPFLGSTMESDEMDRNRTNQERTSAKEPYGESEAGTPWNRKLQVPKQVREMATRWVYKDGLIGCMDIPKIGGITSFLFSPMHMLTSPCSQPGEGKR